jgi:hypothetical protein
LFFGSLPPGGIQLLLPHLSSLGQLLKQFGENPPLLLNLFRISLLSFDPPLTAWKCLTACLRPGQSQDGRIIAKPARWALPDACGFSRYYMFN